MILDLRHQKIQAESGTTLTLCAMQRNKLDGQGQKSPELKKNVFIIINYITYNNILYNQTLLKLTGGGLISMLDV